jgi:hypothetical protein
MARLWSAVQTLEASPYLTPFAQLTAWSSELNRCTVMTGPKISSWIISSCRPNPATTVGAKQGFARGYSFRWRRPVRPASAKAATLVDKLILNE